VLHAVRIKGMATAAEIARRFPVHPAEAEELLLDHEASGHVRRVEFTDLRGWSLTERGRTEDERLLAGELEEASAHAVVDEAHSAFVPLNSRFLETITRWQIRPTSWDAMAANDHSDWRWDEQVLGSLAGLSRRLRPVEERLTGSLARFGGYTDRFAAALARVDRGERKWVDEPRIDSCHTVWFELHEDLLATLGMARGSGS
jgi:hypothetical protein